MSEQTAQWWARARQARDKLVAQLGSHPAVTMIDIGLLEPVTSRLAGLRVHVYGDIGDLSVPTKIDGITVQVIAGTYRLENDETP